MKRLLIILTVLSVAACRSAQIPATPEMLVVEGWIEDGGAPYIYLTTSITPSSSFTVASTSIREHVVATARVSISDGEKEVVLMGLSSPHYFPPFVYTTGHMKGQAGKTYTITVDVGEFHATATATVPPSRELESLSVIPYGDDPAEHLLEARFRNNAADDLCYMSFVKIEKTDSTYVPSEMSLVDGAIAGEEVSIDVRPGGSLARQELRNSYHSGDRVQVKFRTMDRGMHRVWKHIREQHGLSSVPIFVLDENLPGNVQGAQGYFAGYGCSHYSVVIP